MYKAFSEAYQKLEYDFYFWVNDDVLFFPDVLKKLIKLYDSLDYIEKKKGNLA